MDMTIEEPWVNPVEIFNFGPRHYYQRVDPYRKPGWAIAVKHVPLKFTHWYRLVAMLTGEFQVNLDKFTGNGRHGFAIERACVILAYPGEDAKKAENVSTNELTRIN